jgi:hypothetical protein
LRESGFANIDFCTDSCPLSKEYFFINPDGDQECVSVCPPNSSDVYHSTQIDLYTYCDQDEVNKQCKVTANCTPTVCPDESFLFEPPAPAPAECRPCGDNCKLCTDEDTCTECLNPNVYKLSEDNTCFRPPTLDECNASVEFCQVCGDSGVCKICLP